MPGLEDELLGLVAKQTAKFRGMVFWQRSLSFRGMAFAAKFFRFLSVFHSPKMGMLFIVRQFFCGFFRGVQEKEKYCNAEHNKEGVGNNPVLPGLFSHDRQLKCELTFSTGENLTA